LGLFDEKQHQEIVSVDTLDDDYGNFEEFANLEAGFVV